ncbi:hypothetical protein [Planctomyces sp. SH-PL14]|uniref:hypothetical protein n=1 Tax=Planctomyces sp. SH-PL14 TaxID=1632864 RepID=UPI00078ED2E0|nr:hypothetical protein [Planctomyces sp. SH-PL14]AMV22224.1 hypothetical protein VT03_30245 [Planctomyces sp. SH-PL14]
MKNARTPIVVAGLLFVGFWLGNLFRGFGPGGPSTGTGIGTGDGTEQVAEVRDPNAQRVALGEPANMPTIAGPTDASVSSASLPAPGHPLTVVIDGAGYALMGAAGETTPTSLDEIRKLAGEKQGDDQGVRVRILRRKNAQAGAKADLLAALEASGVPSDAVQEKMGFVD